LIVAESCPAASSTHHFFLACLDWILPFSNFFRRLGHLVAGLLTIRRSFLAIGWLPSIRMLHRIASLHCATSFLGLLTTVLTL
jgi:hypothetical protein